MDSSFTCMTCRVLFCELTIQKQHYKSDWHRYNLKRKVAELPPVTIEEFQKRASAFKNNEIAQENNLPIACKVCKKAFGSQNQYANHVESKKHKEKTLSSSASSSLNNLANSEPNGHCKINTVSSSQVENSEMTNNDMEVESDVESIDSDEWLEDTDNPVKNNDCLFCDHHSKSWVRNLKHMTEVHSFFVPDAEYCIDFQGLLIYLGEKIFASYMCIWCNDSGKAFRSADAARAHMIDKGHCKMKHEGDCLLEYAVFYDYSSSYPDAESNDPDTEVTIPEIDDDGYQLVLPSGTTVGHRSLFKYYKQSLNPSRVLAISKSEKLQKVIGIYKQLGWTPSKNEVVKRKINDIRFMKRAQAKYLVQTQIKANKLQPHFRHQIGF